jgi:hypothetical protein
MPPDAVQGDSQPKSVPPKKPRTDLTPEKKVEQLWAEADDPSGSVKDIALDVWKQTVDVQMHFNDICMKIRNLAITVLTAVIGFAAYSLKENIEIDFGNKHLPIGSFIAFGGLAGWIAFWAMDRHWYHNFLRAAGIHAGRVEDRWSKAFPELLLSSQLAVEPCSG